MTTDQTVAGNLRAKRDAEARFPRSIADIRAHERLQVNARVSRSQGGLLVRPPRDTRLIACDPCEIVLDLGSGAGADVLISARRAAPSGRAIGLDMTDEMLELARANAPMRCRKRGVPQGLPAGGWRSPIADPDVDEATKADMAARTGCVAGALTEAEFRAQLTAAGMQGVEIQETDRVHEHAAAAAIRARKSLD
jgi:SAM-dependent methyltransferase